ncbi:MAG: N-acetyltransferase [Spirochaetales bacterium]|nr:N-acetyltransferase [Spirochaetales bacterium]
MAVEIKRVATKRDLRKFIMLPFKIYKGNTYWVPPIIMDEYNSLRKDKNPAFEYADAEYWLAYKDGKPAGRIAGILNPPAVKKWGVKNARFGWVEFIDDREVAKALFDTVESWAKKHGMEGVQGPMGFSDTDKEGMLIEGFDELGTLPMIYNHPYYPKFVESFGYKKDADWLEFEIFSPKAIPEKVLRVNDLVLKRSGLKIAQVKNRKELAAKYGKQLFTVLEEAYEELYGTVPLTEKQVEALIKQYLGFVSLRYTKVIVDESDQLAAFAVTMPSLSRALQKAKGRIFPIGWIYLLQAMRKPQGVDLYLIATRKKYQGRGLNALLMTEITRAGLEDGIKTAETSGELETNEKVQQLWRYYDHRQHKRRRAYVKSLI